MNIIPSKANTAFSKVPHSITFSEILTPHQKMVWIMLDATCYNRETEVVSAAKLAKKWGLPVRGLQKTIQELVLMGFIFMGLMVFGDQNSDYGNFAVSVTSMFRLILSDFDYAALRAVSPSVSPIFLYGFAITISFIMLNMFIAIITEAFKDVSLVLSDFVEQDTGLPWVHVLCGQSAQDLVDNYDDSMAEAYLEAQAEEQKRAAEEKAERKRKREEAKKQRDRSMHLRG